MTMRNHAGAFAIAAALLTGGCTTPGFAETKELETKSGPIRVVEVAKGLENPWGLAFLPDGAMLVTEREGKLRRVERDGKLSNPIGGVPTVWANGQGGLLDVALDPGFAQNRLVYLSFSEPGRGGANTAVARGRLDGDQLRDVQVIFRAEPKSGGPNHFGSRLVFARDGRLFVTLGDRGMGKRAQETDVHMGKVVRIEADGRVPGDNPFVGKPNSRPEIWSYGHRNVQGATLHPQTGALWTAEHGARGGDEVNIPQAGKNYGWPVISYGVNYSGTKIGEGTAKPGMEQPVHYWDPSFAPSGMTFYTADRFPAWKGNLFIGALSGALVRLEVDGARIAGEERITLDERVRDVRQGPDGFLYLLTDHSGGRLLRVEPVGG